MLDGNRTARGKLNSGSRNLYVPSGMTPANFNESPEINVNNTPFSDVEISNKVFSPPDYLNQVGLFHDNLATSNHEYSLYEGDTTTLHGKIYITISFRLSYIFCYRKRLNSFSFTQYFLNGKQTRSG